MPYEVEDDYGPTTWGELVALTLLVLLVLAGISTLGWVLIQLFTLVLP